MENKENVCPFCKSKHRDAEELSALVNRLKRIEGQIRGVIGMLEADAYCVDILTQVSAISSALSSFARELLASHINSCVVEDIRDGREGATEELISVIERFVR